MIAAEPLVTATLVPHRLGNPVLFSRKIARAWNALESRHIPDCRRHRSVVCKQWRPGRREHGYAHRRSRLSVQRLRLVRWTAALAKRLHPDCSQQYPMGYDNCVANMDRVVGLLNGYPVDRHHPSCAKASRSRAALGEARVPKPLIQAQARWLGQRVTSQARFSSRSLAKGCSWSVGNRVW